MIIRAASTRTNAAGVTIVEVMLSALLIFIGLGSIFAMNTHSIELLRATHLTAASTQILQERIESFRAKAWPEISNAKAVAILLQNATDSEKEMNVPNLTETVTMSVPQIINGQVVGKTQTFQVQRRGGGAYILEDMDFGSSAILVVDDMLQWGQDLKIQQRKVRVVICRTGLTRSGIFGSAFGRPAQPSSVASTK